MKDVDLFFDNIFRSFVGADRYRDWLNHPTHMPSFPPYDIVKDDNTYVIQMALAGYSPDDISVKVTDNLLTIESDGSNQNTNDNYMYRGIAKRSFNLKFTLDAHMEVESAEMNNGMLHVLVKRQLPETAVKQIPVMSSSPPILEQEE